MDLWLPTFGPDRAQLLLEMYALKLMIKRGEIMQRNNLSKAHAKGRDGPCEACPAPDPAELLESKWLSLGRKLDALLR